MANTSQSFENHLKFHPYFHFFVAPLTIITAAAAVVNAFKGGPYTPWILALLAVLFVLLAPLLRLNPLTVQDRLIRLEVGLRYRDLSGESFEKLLPNLNKGQIVALRFASDAELVDLARKAAAKGTAPKEIKRSIKNWRADHWRV